jgi:hypothetical protein
VITKGGYIPMDDNRTMPTGQEFGVPGPAFYNPVSEPKKISFLFNAAEKWTA